MHTNHVVINTPVLCKYRHILATWAPNKSPKLATSVGPGARPVLGQVSPEGAWAWAQVGLGSSRFQVGFRSAAPAEPGGARRSAAAEGKKSPQKLGGIQSVGGTVVLSCPCVAIAALSPITVLMTCRLDV
jgi:hypothetical protein